MKELLEYDRVTVYLDKISEYIRTDIFESKLEKPVITLQKTTGAYGHFETIPMWHDEKGNARYEINLGSETITRPIEETVATMIHEYVHYYCLINDIKDTSRNGVYHNKRFKAEAEKRMLKIDFYPSIGFSVTSPTEELVKWCISKGLSDIKIGRAKSYEMLFGKLPTKPTGREKGKNKPSSTRKYYCPKCKISCRATKNIDIMCINCQKRMILE